jgi:hypothetical protein
VYVLSGEETVETRKKDIAEPQSAAMNPLAIDESTIDPQQLREKDIAIEQIKAER